MKVEQNIHLKRKDTSRLNISPDLKDPINDKGRCEFYDRKRNITRQAGQAERVTEFRGAFHRQLSLNLCRAIKKYPNLPTLSACVHDSLNLSL